MLFKLPHFTLWHMLPIAIGLHGVLFAIPIPSMQEEAAKPKPESVNVVNLPKPSPSAIATSKSQPLPKPTPKVQPSAPPRRITSPATPLPQQTIQPPAPQASISPSPSPTVSPSPTISPSPTDALQITGAVPGCQGRAGCWQIAESNGRAVAGTLEQQLQQQGYTLTEQDLAQDTGFRVYEVAKDGVKQYYLHLVWSDRGTAYVRSPEMLSHSNLLTMAGL